MAEFAAVFQIGEDKYGYKYGLTNMRTNSAPVYKCLRGTDQSPVGNCLWLYRSSDWHWIAIDAPKTAEDPINGGQPTFRTQDPVEDISVRQTLQGQYFENRTWAGSMTFSTYPMVDPPPMISAHRDLLAAALPGSTAAGNANLATVPETAAISDITESQQDDVQ